MLRISGPPLQAAPHPVVKDLAKFSRAGNYEISGPRKFCQTRISGPFTTRCTTTFSKGLSRISKGQKFRNFRPPEIQEFPAPEILSRGGNSGPGGRISGPESKFPALKLTLLWMISSLSTVVPFPTSLHHQSCTIPGEFLQCLAQD
jgi:hypothetical protein